MILEVCWDGLWTHSFKLSQFHGHGSWLVCEVALRVLQFFGGFGCGGGWRWPLMAHVSQFGPTPPGMVFVKIRQLPWCIAFEKWQDWVHSFVSSNDQLGDITLKQSVVSSKCFIWSGMGSMDNKMLFKDHFGFKYIHISWFPGQSTNKVLVLKMPLDLASSGVDCVRRMQSGGDMENSWIMLDHVKRLRNWTTVVCHVYNTNIVRFLQ